QQLEALWSYLSVQIGHTGEIAAGPIEAIDKSDLDGIDRHPENDRNGCCRRLCRQGGRRAASCDDHTHMTVGELRRKCRQSIVLALRPPILDRDILTLDIACFFQALAKRAQTVRIQVRRGSAEKSDHRHRRLLRARRERPCDDRAANKRDELAPPNAEHGASSLPYPAGS